MPPIYEYGCAPCDAIWDVAKPMSESATPESCPKCKSGAVKVPSRVNFTGAADWNTQTWNPGLGCYTRNTRHARQIAKSRGCEEIGNESVENVHKHYEKQREDASVRRWSDDRDKLYGS